MARPCRKLLGYEYSENHGQTWRRVALCNECSKSVEPPKRLKKIGEVGVRSCDWCGALNANDSPKGTVTASDSDWWEQMKIDGFNASIGTNIFGSGLEKIEPTENEDLPVDCVMLDIAYSPVIPISGGGLSEAVEVEKINDFTYRFDYRHQQHTVSAEKIKEMRARYIVTHNIEAAKYMVENNPEDHILHKLGQDTLENVSLQGRPNK